MTGLARYAKLKVISKEEEFNQEQVKNIHKN